MIKQKTFKVYHEHENGHGVISKATKIEIIQDAINTYYKIHIYDQNTTHNYALFPINDCTITKIEPNEE